jgi:hypothetical protein
MPILKGKQGELIALEHVQPVHQSGLCPIVEAVTEDPDDVAVVENELSVLAQRIERHRGTLETIVDLSSVADDTPMPSGGLGITMFHDTARSLGCFAVPTVRLGSAAAVVAAANAIAATDGFGACVRLDAGDLDPASLATNITALLAGLSLPEAQVDLVLDFGAIDATTIGAYTSLAQFAIALIPNLNAWRSFALTSGAFPKNLDAFTAYTIGTSPRWDRQFWHQLVAAGVSRQPNFGDYAVGHPEAATAGAFAPAPNVRYTGSLDWHILKGKKGTPEGNHNFMTICQQFIATPASPFRGGSYSWGDDNFARCAARQGGPGGAKEWRSWATSHHIAEVITQLTATGAP